MITLGKTAIGLNKVSIPGKAHALTHKSNKKILEIA